MPLVSCKYRHEHGYRIAALNTGDGLCVFVGVLLAVLAFLWTYPVLKKGGGTFAATLSSLCTPAFHVDLGVGPRVCQRKCDARSRP